VTLDFLESLDRFLASLVNPASRPRSELRMVFCLPGACCGAQCFSLAMQLDLAIALHKLILTLPNRRPKAEH
jgi:hypothetical protein